MSRLTNLIQQAKGRDPQLGADLEAEFRALIKRRSFGLVFERHRPVPRRAHTLARPIVLPAASRP